jgi:hypothetical protein
VIDDEVAADVRAARQLAASTAVEGGVLDGLTWVADTGRVVALHASWREEPRLSAEVRGSLRIGRPELLRVAARCREEGTWAPLLVAVSAWGYGDSGHGARRTRRIAGLADLEVRLDAAVTTLDADGPVEAYYQLANEGHVHGWGPTLFTRFLEAADQRHEEGALGLDASLARAIDALVPGSDLGAADWSTAEYAFYLGLLHRIAAESGAEPTVVEAVLAAKFAV